MLACGNSWLGLCSNFVAASEKEDLSEGIHKCLGSASVYPITLKSLRGQKKIKMLLLGHKGSWINAGTWTINVQVRRIWLSLTLLTWQSKPKCYKEMRREHTFQSCQDFQCTCQCSFISAFCARIEWKRQNFWLWPNVLSSLNFIAFFTHGQEIQIQHRWDYLQACKCINYQVECATKGWKRNRFNCFRVYCCGCWKDHVSLLNRMPGDKFTNRENQAYGEKVGLQSPLLQKFQGIEERTN